MTRSAALRALTALLLTAIWLVSGNARAQRFQPDSEVKATPAVMPKELVFGDPIIKPASKANVGKR